MRSRHGRSRCWTARWHNSSAAGHLRQLIWTEWHTVPTKGISRFWQSSRIPKTKSKELGQATRVRVHILAFSDLLQGNAHRPDADSETIDAVPFMPFVFFVVPLHCGVYDNELVLKICQIHCGRSHDRKARAFRVFGFASDFFDFPARAPETTPGTGMLPGMPCHQRANGPFHLS